MLPSYAKAGTMGNRPSKALLRLILLVSGIAWGLTIAVSPWQVDTGWPPVALIFWQATLSGVVLLLWFAISRHRQLFAAKTLIFFAVMGLCGTALPQVLSLASSMHIAVGVRSIIFALIPMLSLGIALLLKTERWDAKKLLGLTLGFVAMAVIAGPGATTGGFGGTSLAYGWLAVMVVVIALYAFENNWIKLAMPANMNPVVALMGANIFAAMALAPVVHSFGGWIALPLEFSGEHARPTAMFWLVSALQLFAYAGFVYCIDKGGPAFAGQVSYVVTASGVLWGVALFGENLTWTVVLALAVVLCGMWLVEPNQADGEQSEEQRQSGL